MEVNFCRRCGSPLTKLSDQEYLCSNNHKIYTTSAPAVGIFFVIPDGRILLSRRGIEPKKGMLDTVGGFVGVNETFEQAIIREVEEEVGLTKDDYGPLNYVTSAFVQYSFGGEMVLALSPFFWANLPSLDKVTAQDDVAETVVVAVNEIDESELANDDIRHAFRELKNILAINRS